jgi:hypothetical protein
MKELSSLYGDWILSNKQLIVSFIFSKLDNMGSPLTKFFKNINQV